jgi:hypothetical protein
MIKPPRTAGCGVTFTGSAQFSRERKESPLSSVQEVRNRQAFLDDEGELGSAGPNWSKVSEK